MAKQSWTVHLPPTTKVGNRARHKSIQQDTYFVVIGDSHEMAERAFTDYHGSHVANSFLTDDGTAFGDLMTSQEGRVSSTSGDDLLEFVGEVQLDLGSITIDSVLAEFDRPGQLRRIRYNVSEGPKRRVFYLDAETDNSLDAQEIAELIEAKF